MSSNLPTAVSRREKRRQFREQAQRWALCVSYGTHTFWLRALFFSSKHRHRLDKLGVVLMFDFKTEKDSLLTQLYMNGTPVEWGNERAKQALPLIFVPEYLNHLEFFRRAANIQDGQFHRDLQFLADSENLETARDSLLYKYEVLAEGVETLTFFFSPKELDYMYGRTDTLPHFLQEPPDNYLDF